MKAGYVDGFVLVVPKNKVSTYKKMATWGKKTWKKHGALDYKECIAEQLNPNTHGMKQLGFAKMAKKKANETVWFSFVTYHSKKHRDQVNARVMKEMMKDTKNKDMPMPFDMKRMAYGGFKVIVQ